MTTSWIASSSSRKGTRGLELPVELSGKIWLHMDGTPTPQAVVWNFREGGVYQIQQDSDRLLLVFLHNTKAHHVFRSYRTNWLTTFTDSQLIGREVLMMEKDMKHCPHCDGKVLKVEVTNDKAGADGQFLGQISCLDKGCGAVTRWQIAVPRTPAEEKDKQQAAAMERLIAAWNRRG